MINNENYVPSASKAQKNMNEAILKLSPLFEKQLLRNNSPSRGFRFVPIPKIQSKFFKLVLILIEYY